MIYEKSSLKNNYKISIRELRRKKRKKNYMPATEKFNLSLPLNHWFGFCIAVMCVTVFMITHSFVL